MIFVYKKKNFSIKIITYIKNISIFSICIITLMLLNGCNNIVLMSPKGEIGIKEKLLMLEAFGLMLLIVIPVIIMTIVFTAKYRKSNTRCKQYNPKLTDSKLIELITWCAPILIIIILATITWQSTKKLDPKKLINSKKLEPIIIDVISLDWKWLFIYPKYSIATINKLVIPSCTPIEFNITSNSVMNSFFIPQLGSQIYAMAGMHTKLNLIANQAGTYKGISSNFSGSGFSNMKFIVIATTTDEEFIDWIKKVKLSSHQINNLFIYEDLAKPSKNHPITYFSYVKPNLFSNIINKFYIQKK